MGRRKNQQFNHFAQKKRMRKEMKENGQEVENKRPVAYQDLVRENTSFDAYYKHQKLVSEEEWPAFKAAHTADLPTTFRITGYKGEAQALLQIIEKEFFTDYLKSAAELNETSYTPPFALPWYPNGLAWQLKLSRKDIRRSEAFYKLHNFLIAETSSGAISRQEAVSMIPPLVLDIKEHHRILDMCAAPGSKTAQLIEALHADAGNKTPTGFVIANDLDNKRCYMLVHQTKRLNSPCFLVTNQDSAMYPTMKTLNAEGKEEKLKFDRILCDVPCSGDGTMRKNPDIWAKWNTAQGTNLNGVQYRIGKRGAELLNIGGRMVYSTCSLNPMENEAVIYRLLKDSDGALELVDATSMLPGLKYTPGMTYWEPATKDLVFYKSFEEVPEKWVTIVRPAMFAPPADDPLREQLTKCIRILPHQQDTGAFFVAVLVKKKEVPWTQRNLGPKIEGEEEEKKTPAEGKPEKAEGEAKVEGEGEKKKDENAWGPQRKKRRIGGYNEDPFSFFGANEEAFEQIKSYYDLSEKFNPKCFLTRCLNDKKKNIYFCSDSIRDIVQLNEGHVKIINTGVKSFVRCDNRNMKCPFRLAQEGLSTMNEFLGQTRRLKLPRDDLILLLQSTDPTKPPLLSELSAEGKVGAVELTAGSCILEYEDKEKGFELTLVGWRGTTSMRAYVDTDETIHMLRLMGADISKYEKNKYQQKEVAAETVAEVGGEEIAEDAPEQGDEEEKEPEPIQVDA